MKTIKIMSFVLATCFCFLSFCSCSSNKTALTINSVAIDEGIFGYYLSVAANSNKYKEEKDKQAVAGKLCAEYVAGTELLKKYNIQLSPEEKVIVSSEVKTNWQLYSDFYSKYSVSKQALCSILEYEKMIDSFVETLYSANGERALSDEEIKIFFNNNYIAAKVAFTTFDDPSKESEVNEISNKFASLSGIIRAGGDFSSAIQQYPDLAEYEDTDRIISAFDSSYPNALFKKLLEIKQGDVQVVRFPRGIYLVQKTDASQFFDVYKSKCIIKMKKQQVLDEISTLAKDYKTEFNSYIAKKVMYSADV